MPGAFNIVLCLKELLSPFPLTIWIDRSTPHMFCNVICKNVISLHSARKKRRKKRAAVTILFVRMLWVSFGFIFSISKDSMIKVDEWFHSISGRILTGLEGDCWSRISALSHKKYNTLSASTVYNISLSLSWLFSSAFGCCLKSL